MCVPSPEYDKQVYGMTFPKDGAQAFIASSLTKVTWEQVTMSIVADTAVAASYVLLLFVIVLLNRSKRVSIFVPRRAYYYAFAMVLVINSGASVAALFMTGAAITLTYKLLVAALISFTAAAIWRVLPRRADRQNHGDGSDVAPPNDTAEATICQRDGSIANMSHDRQSNRSEEGYGDASTERYPAGESVVSVKPGPDDLILRTSTAVVILDARGSILNANAASAQLFGHASIAEMMNRPLTRLLGLTTGSTIDRFIKETLEHGTCALTLAVDPSSRGPVQVELDGAATICAGEPCVVALVREVPESTASREDLLQSRDALATALEAARRINTTRSEFMARMNHELRTPLNGIIGLAEVMRHRAMEGRLAASDILRMSENIQQSGAHLLSLIDDLLDLSRLEAGSGTLSPIAVGIRNEIDTATTTLASISDKKRIRIVNQCDEGLKWAVDRRAFKQIVINLVNNAVKFSPSGSRILINATHGTEMMRLSVADEGPGISPDDRKRILLPFGRGEVAESQNIEGVGLGLTIVTELLRLQGGRLEVDNSESGGAIFTAIFPVGAAARPETTSEQPAS